MNKFYKTGIFISDMDGFITKNPNNLLIDSYSKECLEDGVGLFEILFNENNVSTQDTILIGEYNKSENKWIFNKNYYKKGPFIRDREKFIEIDENTGEPIL